MYIIIIIIIIIIMIIKGLSALGSDAAVYRQLVK